jgi:hypothetical protein
MFEERRGVVGDFEPATSFRFGGIPFEVAEKSMRLDAKEVLPVLHTPGRLRQHRRSSSGQRRNRCLIHPRVGFEAGAS